MSRSLKLFITGLVSLSVLALVLTSFVYSQIPSSSSEFDLEIALRVGQPLEVEVLLGLAFWIVSRCSRVHCQCECRAGSLVSVSMAPIVGAMALGGPGGRRLGGPDRNDRGARDLAAGSPGTEPLRITPVVVLPAVLGGIVCRLLLGREHRRCSGSFVSSMIGAAIFFVLNMGITSVVVALRTSQPFRVVALGDWRGISVNALALAPLAWLMAQIYVLGWWASLLFALAAVHDPRRLSPLRRDARDVHADDRSARRGGRQARSVHQQAQPSGQADRGRHRQGDARQRAGARGARVGRPAP